MAESKIQKKPIEDLIEETKKFKWHCIFCGVFTEGRGAWNTDRFQGKGPVYALCENCRKTKTDADIERELLRRIQ